MPKIQTLPVKLREWFKPSDTLAPYIARPCILSEGLFLEMCGIATDGLQDLDANSFELYGRSRGLVSKRRRTEAPQLNKF